MTIESVAEFYCGTEVGQQIHNKGSEQGREEGREEGFALTLLLLLRARFGNDRQFPAIAEQLARRPDQEAVVNAITKSSTLGELMDQLR